MDDQNDPYYSTYMDLVKRGSLPVGMLNWRFGGDQSAEMPEVQSPQFDMISRSIDMWRRLLARHGLGMNQQNQNGY